MVYTAAMPLARGVLVATLVLAGTPAGAQLSSWSVQTFGQESSTKDCVRAPIGGQPGDVGAGAFTIEQWIRCARADNPPNDSPPAFYPPDSTDTGTGLSPWIWGRIFLDRDVAASGATGGGTWGASIHRATDINGNSVIRWGAIQKNSNAHLNVQGSTDVCDDAWHHVAVGRDATNHLFIIVDGVEDYRSTGANAIAGSLALPAGATDPADPYIVWGNEKQGFPGFPGLVGHMDELRVWSTERSAAQIAANRFVTLAPDTANLELYLRLEEGDGQAVADHTGKNPGVLFYLGDWTTEVPSGGGTTSTSTTSTSTVSPVPTTTSTVSPIPTTTSTSTVPPVPTTTSTSQPGSTSSTTTAPGPGPSTTSTTLARACSRVEDCDDLDPCTADDCVAGTCRAEPASGVGGATCELRRFVDAPLCPADPPRRKIERAIARPIAAAARLFDAAAAAGVDQARGRRKLDAALEKLDGAERRVRRAIQKQRLAEPCATVVLLALERARAALPSSERAPITR